jgi:hypothetical protein
MIPAFGRRRNMKWRRQMNYHGSRTYGDDEAAESRLRLDLAVLGGWVKQQLEKMLRAGAPASEDFRTLVDARERNFSLLGGANENRHAIATPIWPSPAEKARTRLGHAGARRKDMEAGGQPRA